MRKVRHLTALGLIGAMAAAGCGTGITSDLTIAEAVGKIDIFNQLTVGDVIEAFNNFVGSIDFERRGPARLTEDQRAEFEMLQAQLDAGEITEDEFTGSVRELIGDQGAGFAFGGFEFFGGPFGHRFGDRLGAKLELTDEQKAAAKDIFMTAHEDIDTLRAAAKEAMRDTLTEEQLAKLDELRDTRRGRFGQHRAFSRLAEALELTDEQIGMIETIRTDLRTDIEARHMQARDEFRALLTADQIAILDEIEAAHPNFDHGFGHGFGHEFGHGRGHDNHDDDKNDDSQGK